jgi:hypothetical protein
MGDVAGGVVSGGFTATAADGAPIAGPDGKPAVIYSEVTE